MKLNALSIRTIVAMALLTIASVAWATHVASPSEPVNYDGSLSSGVPVNGSIGFVAPVDGYDWYCFAGTAGQQVSLTMTRTSGNITPNIQVYSGVTASGTTLGASGLTLVTGTSSSTAGPAVATFTPTASVSYTVSTSTFGGEAGGDYTLLMTGAAATTCAAGGPGPVPAVFLPVPTLSQWALILMSLLLAGTMVVKLRRR